MKNALLILAVTAIACRAKAQQLFQLNPTDSLKTDLFQLYRAPKINIEPFLTQPKIEVSPLFAANTSVKIAAYDHMPVALLSGYSKMPILKLKSDDRMPVMKMGENEVAAVPNASKTP